MKFSEKIGQFQFYNFDVHQIYILQLHIFEKSNLTLCFHAFSIHFNTFLIVNVLFSMFLETHLMDLKMLYGNKIGLIVLYNFDMLQIYNLLWHQYEKLSLKFFSHIFFIHSNTFLIVKVLILNFSQNSLNEFENGLQQ